MAEEDVRERPQIYLITPADADPTGLADRAAALLDAVEVACLRLSLASQDEDVLRRAADRLRATAHARDVPVVITDHFRLAAQTGLDGVHLTSGARNVAKARKELGSEAIIGAHCGVERHGGMNAGEAGADYVSFGPVNAGALGDGRTVDPEIFAWWSQMIEIPVVAEGNLDRRDLRNLGPVVDFVGLSGEVWDAADPVAALKEFDRALD